MKKGESGGKRRKRAEKGKRKKVIGVSGLVLVLVRERKDTVR